ncbi:hypothetical protein C6T60_04770 [Burkholderia multivorans]|nr:hypothetical protein C6T60_04770 [Burkholderia multivorans]
MDQRAARAGAASAARDAAASGARAAAHGDRADASAHGLRHAPRQCRGRPAAPRGVQVARTATPATPPLFSIARADTIDSSAESIT